jgi:hypothetical protein
MTREEMVSKLIDTFQSSDEESLMLAAEAKENPDGSFNVRVTEGTDNELFTIYGEVGQTIEELRGSFEGLMNEAIQTLTDEQVDIEKINPAEF